MTTSAGQATDPFWAATMRRWNAVCWVLFAAMAVGLAAMDRPGGSKYWALGLLGLLMLCYAVVDRFPDNPVLRPHTYLLVLVTVLGVFAYLRSSFGSLFMVTLPHFWMFSRTPRASLLFLGLATGSTLTGSWLRLGNSPKFFGETLVPVVIVVAVGVLIGLWVHSVVAQSHERARLIVELEQTQAELSEAHQRQGAADERERMARDIHDTLAQGFASIIVLAEAARAGLDSEPARSAQRLRSIQQLRSIESTARENLAEARELVGSAQQQGQVAAGSVAQTLRRILDRFAEDTGLTVDADLADIECDQPTRIALLRCTQESLANVRKHARASTVGVVLARQPYGVELEVTDDGAGFVVGRSAGFGLDGMRKRLAELGGELTVTSSVGDGTRVLATISTDGVDAPAHATTVPADAATPAAGPVEGEATA
ncbi:sensor histidine kinase [Streptomyces phaeochromogenes]|uniref:sensor histidine kinase n=1 Tax=Streptomyces phaeochromogenes TaxID=1923 RepID=UPI0037237A05